MDADCPLPLELCAQLRQLRPENRAKLVRLLEIAVMETADAERRGRFGEFGFSLELKNGALTMLTVTPCRYTEK